MHLKFPQRTSQENYPACLDPEKCLAKSLFGSAGCNIYTHLYAACMMFRMLRQIWQGTRKGDFFFPAAEWCAAFHDIGKMSPAFQDKLYRAIHLADQLPWSDPIQELPGGHARLSAIVLESYFQGKHVDLVRMAGGHHGSFYELKAGDNLRQIDLGGPSWQEMREKLLRELTEKLQLPECGLDSISREMLPVMLGSVILADWLSSSIDLAPDSPIPDENTLRKTIETAGLIPHPIRSGLKFQDLFGFEPNPMQQNCLDHLVPGGIYVIESGMGSGKTEAALGIAYELISKKQADGIYFALPTQLTSEKIYERLNCFLKKTVDEPNQQAILIHADSWLDWTLKSPDENGDFKSTGSWFQSKKRALLAAFGAGTVDQALLAEVRVRHNSLRAFALAGKVVIIDEIHSYDAYTGSILSELIGDLRRWGCTVILLSATLTSEACRLFAQMQEPPQNRDYPRLLINDHGRISIIPIQAPVSCRVALEMTDDEDAVLKESIARAEEGQQVLWIENTVHQAQEIFRRIKALAPDLETGLVHSRFPAWIRSEKEDYWTGILGKDGADRRAEHGRMLVATQILEQSVDVDADLLISRIAPADFLFQRIGRLWRHPKLSKIRSRRAQRRCIILTPGILSDPVKLEQEKNSFLPYSAYWIRRTWEILREKSVLSVPDDIRPVLELLYGDRREESVPLQHLKAEDERKKEQLLRLADMAVAELGDTPDDDSVPVTRFSEDQTVQLLLLRKGNRGEKFSQIIYPFFSLEPIELPSASAPRKKQLETAGKLLPLMLKIPARYAPDWSDFPVDFLEHILWTGDGSNRPVRAAYIDESGRILDQSCNIIKTNHHFQFEYHPLLGYIYRKMEDSL